MALNQIIDLSTTAGNNLDFIGVGIPEGMFPDKVNDAMRALGKILADAVPRHVVKTVGTYAPAKTDHNQFWRCTGAVTLNLTAAATLTDGWCLWVRANGGAVTIDPSGAETINGAATLVLPDGSQALIICNATTFYSILDTSVLNPTSIGATTAGTGAFTTLSATTSLVIPNAAAPAPTVEADVRWDTNEDVFRVGNGSTSTQIGLALGTSVATTSGTSVDFTGLPAGVKRITLSLSGVSVSGTAIPWVQIGDSGGIETTSYVSANTLLNNAVAVTITNNTSAFAFGQGNAVNTYQGSIVLTLIDPATFLWACNGALAFGVGTVATYVQGSKATSATLDRIRLTTSNGTDTFDAGTVNIMYE